MQLNKLNLVLTVLLLTAVFSKFTAAQQGEQLAGARKLFETSVISGKADYLLQAKALLTPLAAGNTDALYLLAVTEYKIAEAGLRKEYASLYDSAAADAAVHAKALTEVPAFAAEARVLQAGLAMLRISKNWSEAVALTPLFYTLLAEAEGIAPENPRVHYFRGLMQFNTPEMFGGSKADAMASFLKANALFEDAAEQDSAAFLWCRLETLAWTGQAYAGKKEFTTARFYYQKALALAPEFAWVKYVLLPGLAKAEGNQ